MRVEFRPALKENLWWLLLFNGLAVFMAVGTVVWRVYANTLETLGIVAFVLYFGVWPWAYLRWASCGWTTPTSGWLTGSFEAMRYLAMRYGAWSESGAGSSSSEPATKP
jgi:hypothetical protein